MDLKKRKLEFVKIVKLLFLEKQLDEMTREFINDIQYNRLEGKTLYVSSIFNWFSEDFNNDVVGFFLKYAQGNLKKQLEENKNNIQIKYLDYDWSLNDIKR